MRFMILRKADKATEAGVMPSEKLLTAIGSYMEEMAKAGVLLGGEGLKPLQARARNMLGYALYRLGHYSAAIEVLDQALVDAGEDGARRAQILGDRSLALGALGHHDEAIAEAGRALELAPDSAALNHILGFVLHFAGRPSDAIGPIERALEIDPGFMAGFKTLALAQAATGKGDAAVDVLQRALRHNPLDADTVLQLSYLHVERGSFAAALETLEPYLKEAPDNVRALNNQGLALRGLKRFDEARRALKRASRLSTDDPMVLTNLGRVLLDLGRAAEARSLHEHALRGLPGDSRLLGHYGACLAALGERDKARETLEKALVARFPDLELSCSAELPFFRPAEPAILIEGAGLKAARSGFQAPPYARHNPGYEWLGGFGAEIE